MINKIKGYTIGMSVIYGGALLACLICDLVLNDSLTWFYMVFVSVLISFSITNLPLIVRKGKLVIPAIAVTVLTYILLFVCCVYVDGDWLLYFAYPIATYSFVAAWILLFVLKSRKINWGFKMSVALLVSGIFTWTCNRLVFALSRDTFHFMDLFYYDGGVANNSSNSIVFGCLLAGAIVSAGIGFVLKTQKPSARS